MSLTELKGKKLILASQSPRRADLLRLIGLEFTVVASRLNEDDEEYTVPEVQVLELAHKKAEKIAETIEEGIVVGADTIVVLDGQIMGKPRDEAEAAQMLKRLSGHTHTVLTGFTIFHQPSHLYRDDYEKTEVTFRDLSEKEIMAYIATGSPFDKAGAYGIQDHSAIFVKRIDGCFYNVVGFPVSRFYESLQKFLQQVNET